MEKIYVSAPTFNNDIDAEKKMKLTLSLSECENIAHRTLECPFCEFPIAGVFADAVGHFHVKCQKCKAVMVVNLAYFRRTHLYNR